MVKKKLFRPINIIFIFPALILLLAFFLLGFFSLPPGEKLVKNQLTSLLSKKTGLKIEAREFRLNLFNLKASLKQITIHSGADSQLPLESFSCEKLNIQAGWSLLSGKNIHLRSLELFNPSLKLKSTRTGSSAGADAESEEAKNRAGTFDIRIENLRLTGGQVAYREEAVPLKTEIKNLEFYVSFISDKNRHNFKLSSGPVNVQVLDKEIELKQFQLEGGFDRHKVELTKCRFASAKSSINLKMSLNDYLKEPTGETSLSGHLDLAEAAEWFSSELKPEGFLEIDLALSGAVKEPQIHGTIKGNQLVMSGWPPVDLSLLIDTSGEKNYLLSGELKTEEGGIKLQARTASGFKGPFQAEVFLEKISLGILTGLLPKLPVTFSSVVSGELKFQVPDFNLSNSEAEVRVNVLPVKGHGYYSKASLPVAGDINAKYHSGQAELNRFSLQVLGVEVSVNGTFEQKGRISGKSRMQIDNLSDLKRRVEETGLGRIIPGWTEINQKLGETGGRLLLMASLGGTFQKPYIYADVSGDRLNLAGLEFPVLEGEFSASLDSIKVRHFLLKLNEGRLEGSGELLRKTENRNVYSIQGDIIVSGLKLNQLAVLLPEGSREFLNGEFNASVGLTGTSVAPVLKYRVSVEGLAAGTLHVDSCRLTGEYSLNRISIDDLMIQMAEGQLTGKLAYNFGADKLDLVLKASSLKLTQFASWLPGVKSGQVDLELIAAGGLQKPVASMILSGQGLVYDRFWFPYFELRAVSDGQKADFKFQVPRFNLNLSGGLKLESPYLLTGQLQVVELPLSTLAGLLPLVEEVPASTALTARADFEVPITSMDKFRAELSVSNFDFEGLASLVPGLKSMEPSGSADFYLKLEGLPSSPEKLRLLAEIQNLSLSINQLPIRNERPIRMVFEDSRLKSKDVFIRLGNSLVTLTGEANFEDIKNPRLDFEGRAELKLADFNPWLSGMNAGGVSQVDLKISGSLNKPELRGNMTLQQAYLRFQDLPVVLSEVNALVSLKGQELKLESLEGLANSGKFSGQGQVQFGTGFGLSTAGINIRLKDFDFNFQGLNTVSEASLKLSKEKTGWLLKGDLNLVRASYREDFYPSLEGLKMAFTRVSPAGSEMPAFLHDLLLDVNVRSLENIIVKNNLADLEMKLNLNVKGTVPAPIILGRVENAYPGQIMVGERKYTVERLRADFMGKESLEPYVDVYLTSTVYDEDEQIEANLVLNGPVSDLQFSLTSNPSRSPEDLASLLLTGKSFRQVQGSAINTITGQLIQQFSSPLTSPVTRTLKKVLKAEDIVFEPLNIATLQDPGARLTIRKNMARGVAVTYSIDLANSQRQAWIVDYNWKRNLSFRGFRRDDGKVGASFRHRFSVGSGQRAETSQVVAEPALELREVVIEGDNPYPEDRVIRILGLKPGKPFKSSEGQKVISRLNNWFFKNGYLNVRTDWRQERVGDSAVRLIINVQAGPRAEIKFFGDSLPRRIKRKAANSWINRLPEEANLEQLSYEVESELKKLGYYQCDVQVSRNVQNKKVIYQVEVRKGGRWKIADFRLEGNPVYNSGLIKRVVSDYFGAKAKGLWNLVYDQKVALELIDYFYRENGYLKVKVEKPVILRDESKKRLYLTLKIEAGPQSHVRDLRIKGNKRLSREELIPLLSLKPGEVFSWPALAMDRTAVLNRYRSLGFKEARVVASARPAELGSDYDVIFEIEEGQDFRVAGMEVEGTGRTKPSFIFKTSGLKTGQPVSLESMARAQKNLYDSGAFQSVNVSSVPVSGTEEKVLIKIQEKPWLTFNYGLQYNTETKFEGFFETDFNNLFGYGWGGLVYLRANKRQQDARLSVKIPYLFSRKTDLIASVFYLKDSKELYITEQLGASLQQKITVVRGFNLSWVYKLSRVHDYEKVPSWPFPYDVRVFTSELSLLLNRDTRDDKFDPKKGMLLTANLSYSPRFLGSDLNYFSTFTQASVYKAIGSKIIWASCYRIGLASAFGEYLIPSKRFYAGGGTSIRGFKLDAIGPVDLWTGLPEGGEAVLVINQELRFPMYKFLRGVAFFDAGNVYYRLRDFKPFSLRTSAGFGLRIESPLGLLRIDYGVNLKPRPGETKSAVFFSIGQAF